MELLDHIIKTTHGQRKLEIPEEFIKRNTDETAPKVKLTDEDFKDVSPLGYAVRVCIRRTGLSYADLKAQLAKHKIKVSQVTLHSLATNPKAGFKGYDTKVIIKKLNYIRKEHDSGLQSAWIEKNDIKRKVEEYLNHPDVISMAEEQGKKTTVFLRDAMGLKEERLKFSQWKAGRYRVRAAKWEEASSKVKQLINSKK